jgi:ribonuclease HI
VIADFIAERIEPISYTEGSMLESPWMIYCDGAWSNARAEVAYILISPSGINLRYATILQFIKETDKCTNNIAKYEAILLGFHKLRATRVQRCIIRIDTKVVIRQIEKECITRETTLEKYLALIRRMKNYFMGFTVEHI